jgi:acetyl esterase/lipase
MTAKVHIPSTVSKQAAAFLAELPGADEAFPPTPEPDDLEGWRAMYQAIEDALGPYNDESIDHYGAEVDEVSFGGVPALDIRPANWNDDGRLIVFMHGGAYTLFSPRTTLNLTVPIAADTGLRVVSIDYTLAPVARFEQIIDEVLTVIGELIGQGHKAGDMVFMGDSAGGGLAAGAILAMRDRGMALPACLVLQSPWSDITETGDTYVTLREHEPMYYYDIHLANCAEANAGPDDLKHPYVSPVYGDYSQGYVPTLIQGGTKEIFLSNFVRHYQALDQAGVQVKLDLYEGMPHDFMLDAPHLPESIMSRQKARAFIETHLP